MYKYIFIPSMPSVHPLFEFEAVSWQEARALVAGREGELYGKIYGEVGDYEPTAY